MGSLLILRPGHARLPDLTPLPDGRYRLTVYQKLPAAHYVPPAYGTLYDDTLSGEEAIRYSGLRLINVDPGNERYKPSVPAVTLIYEQLTATGRNQVGRLTIQTDDSGGQTMTANWLQFSSDPYVKPVAGTDTAPGRPDAAYSSETSVDDGILRKITTTYKVATSTLTELGSAELGVKFETGIQTTGQSDRVITRQYTITNAYAAAQLVRLIPPALTDPVFLNAHIVDQQITPINQSISTVTRVFAEVPTAYSDWDDQIIQLPGVEAGDFQLDDFPFRSAPTSEAVAVRIDRKFFLSNPIRIPKVAEFRPVDADGNRATVLTDYTTPSSSEYLAYVNGGAYLCDRCSIHRWRGDIWERRTVWFKAR